MCNTEKVDTQWAVLDIQGYYEGSWEQTIRTCSTVSAQTVKRRYTYALSLVESVGFEKISSWLVLDARV
jgi:hypothetical protein